MLSLKKRKHVLFKVKVSDKQMFVFCRIWGEHSGLCLSTFILTYTKGVLLELRGEVRDVGQTVKVSLQDVPAHLIVKRVPELCWHLGDVDKSRPGKTVKSYIIMIYLCLHFCSITPPSGSIFMNLGP